MKILHYNIGDILGEFDILLVNGECLSVMEDLSSKIQVDMILTDPPFGVTSMLWDSVIDINKMWYNINNIKKDGAPILLFSTQPFASSLIVSNPKEYKYEIIWEKNVPTGMVTASYRPMRYHENILVFGTTKQSTYNPQMRDRVGVGKSCYNYDHYCGDNNHIKMEKIKKRYDPDFVQPSTVIKFNTVPNRKGRLHPSQKPVELLEYLIKTYTNENDIVLDFTAGSMSTGIACMNTGRRFIGIELDEDYFKVGYKRIIENNIK